MGIVVVFPTSGENPKSSNIKYHGGVPREKRWETNGHKGMTLWMTGLSGSGKSTISVALEEALVHGQPKSYFVYRLDGDNLRFGLNKDLGFSPADRKENVRRVAEVSKLFAEAGAIVIAGLISPYKADRNYAREIHVNSSLPFMEVFIDAPYEAPENPEVHCRTDQLSITQSANKIMEKLDEAGIHLHRTFRPMPEPTEDSCTK